MNTKYHLYSSMPMLQSHKAYAEINLCALKNNYKILKNEIEKTDKNTKIICVLKADAYGHGAKNCCKALLEEGCDFFAVSSIEEAIDIRNICNECKKEAEILILGYTLPTQAPLLAKYNIITSLVDFDYAKHLAEEARKCGVKVRCHIKLDTGMNRIGLPARNEKEISDTVEKLKETVTLPSLDVCGMFTHFAKADEESGKEESEKQAERFVKTDKLLMENGIDVKFRHVCNSAAALKFPKYRFDGCRLGIALYGTHSSRFIDKYKLSPVMKLCTVISHVHTLNKGDAVSYGGNYVADEERLVATIPIGYADGFVRAYSGACVTVITEKGKFEATVIGRICMDQCMIDITGSDARVGDKVVIFGEKNDSLTKLAKMSDTIEYECLCLVTSRIPRIVTDM